MARSNAATPAARTPEIIQPMMRITRKPIIRGMAPKNRLSAVASEVVSAAPQASISIVFLTFQLDSANAWQVSGSRDDLQVYIFTVRNLRSARCPDIFALILFLKNK